MTLIRCTKKLQKTLGIKSSDIASELNDSSVFGSWYANLIEINPIYCVSLLMKVLIVAS